MRFSLRTMMEAIFVLAVLLMMWRIYHPPGIRPGETLEIQVIGTLLDQPINGIYRVDETGNVSLGAAYGSVPVAGLETAAARDAVNAHLKKALRSPEVSVSRTGDDHLVQLQATNRKLVNENGRLKQRLSECQSAGTKASPN